MHALSDRQLPTQFIAAVMCVALCGSGLLAPVARAQATAQIEPVYEGLARRGEIAADATRSDRIDNELRRALDMRGVVRRASFPARGGSSDVNATEARLLERDLRDQLAIAQNAYLDGRWDQAEGACAAAITRFESTQVVAAPSSRALWLEAWLLRAAILQKRGNDAHADAAIDRAIIANVDEPLTDGVLPPKVSARLTERKSIAVATPRAQVEIVPTPRDAEVLLDGVSVGRGRVRIDDVMVGTHLIAVRTIAGAATRNVDVAAAGATIELEAPMPQLKAQRSNSGLLDLLAGRTSEEQLIARASATSPDVIAGVLVKDQGADALVLVRVRSGKAVFAGRRLPTTGSPTDVVTQLVDDVLNGRSSWLGLSQPAQGLACSTVGAGVDDGDVAAGNPALWIGLAVGTGVVVLGGAAAIIWAVTSQEPPGMSVTLDASRL